MAFVRCMVRWREAVAMEALPAAEASYWATPAGTSTGTVMEKGVTKYRGTYSNMRHYVSLPR